MPTVRLRCASESVGRGEPIEATASRVRRWLVLEQPGPWGHDALLQSRLDHEIAHTLRSRATRHGVRIVLARRPGWPAATDTRRVFLAHTRPEGGWMESLTCDDEALMSLDLSVLRSRTAPQVGSPCEHPIVMVCTNGRHDACCADLGRPVVRALLESGATDVWECSHIGGDRFAANLVALPSGVYLGRVPPDRAVATVADLAAGVIDLDLYRGRSCHPTLVQAAEISVRRRVGERRVDGLILESVTQVDDDEVVARFRHADRTVTARVRRRRSETAPLTCAGGTGRPWSYEVLDVR
jgi:hypothetical protein